MEQWSVKGALAGQFGSSAGVAAWEARAAKWHDKTTEDHDEDEAEDLALRGLSQRPIVVNVLDAEPQYGCSRTQEVLVPVNGEGGPFVGVAFVGVPGVGVRVGVLECACFDSTHVRARLRVAVTCREHGVRVPTGGAAVSSIPSVPCPHGLHHEVYWGPFMILCTIKR